MYLLLINSEKLHCKLSQKLSDTPSQALPHEGKVTLFISKRNSINDVTQKTAIQDPFPLMLCNGIA